MSARLWAWAPAALLGGLLTGLATMATLAIRDPSFALEPDYYAKAVAYDQEIAQRGQNAELGWALSTTLGAAARERPTPLSVKLRAPDGSPVVGAQIAVSALRNAGASVVLEAGLVEQSPGDYRGALRFGRGGIWELRYEVSRGTARFTSSQRHELAEAAP
jgi:hypothetical protein